MEFFTTGANRCGRSLKRFSSICFGSIRIILTCSGVARIKSDIRIELMQTLFPEPVAPAMSRWGMSPRSASTG